MLGLANILSASSSTDQETYSLDLDGTGDYLNSGSTFQSTIRGSFSWSLWVKPDDGQPAFNDVLFGTKNSANEDVFFVVISATGDADAGKIIIQHEANNDPATVKTDNAIFPNGACDWTHVCVTVTKDTNTSYIIYVDGVAVAATLSNAVAEAAHAAWTSSDNFYIGGNNNDGSVGSPFTGKMDEVALFNVALSAAEVAGIYNNGRPFNLTNDYGDYDQSAALVAYWKMFDGAYDNKVNGVVHDAHNPGIGGEEVTNGTFDSDLTGWTLVGLDDENTIAVSDGKVVMATDGNNGDGGALLLRQTGDFAPFVIGKTYKIEFDAYDITGAGFKIQNATNEDISAITADGHYIKYHVATSTRLDIYRRTTSSASSGKLDNISVKLLNGFPALTAADATFSTDTPSKAPRNYALDCDGTDDYLDIGNVLNLGTGDFSISAWIKAVDLTSFHILSKFEDANNEIRLSTQGDDKLYWKCITGGDAVVNFTAGSAMTALENTWVHVCVTADRDGNGTMYVNGATTLGKAAADMSEDAVNLDNTGDWYVGRRDSAYSDGLIDEVAIWDEALPADAVVAIHAAGRGHDLTTATGNYDGDWTDDLQGYWRMGDGQDDDAEAGVIHDATNPGFGSELVVNGGFDDSGEWTSRNDEVDNGNGPWVISGGKATIDCSSNSILKNNDNYTIVAGATYKCTFDVTERNSGTVRIRMGTGSGAGTARNAVGTYTEYIVGVAQANNINFEASFSSGFDGSIDNVSVVRLNGNPGVTAGGGTFVKLPI